MSAEITWKKIDTPCTKTLYSQHMEKTAQRLTKKGLTDLKEVQRL